MNMKTALAMSDPDDRPLIRKGDPHTEVMKLQMFLAVACGNSLASDAREALRLSNQDFLSQVRAQATLGELQIAEKIQ